MLLHRNLVANVLQVEAWNAPMVAMPPVTDRIIVVTALPLYHIFALTACFLFGIRTGGMCILIPNPRDIAGLIKDVSHYKVNLVPGGEHALQRAAQSSRFRQARLSMLKSAVAGGMAVQKSVADAWVKATGKPIVEGYGLSETSPVLTCNRGDIAEWTGTIGFPVPSTEISIRDDDGHEVPLGEHGEICARGPQVMPGYWQRPDETAKVMTADGFFRTGDIGVMDEQGRVKIIDRKKDMISVSGFKVFPNEVEDVAMMQGGVLECAAVGVPDRHSGEAVKLFAVKKSPDLNEQELRQYLHSQLAGYKVPKQIEFRKELPKTNVGKILRRALRDDAMSEAPALPSPADVIAFWRAAGPKKLVREGRRFRRRHPPAFPHAARSGRRRQTHRLGSKRGGRAGAAHPARSVPAQHVPRAGARLRQRSAGARHCQPRHPQRLRRRLSRHARLFLSAVRTFGGPRRPGARPHALQGGRRRRRPEMGGDSRRHHPPLRPLPASQRGARPRQHAGGAEVSR